MALLSDNIYLLELGPSFMETGKDYRLFELRTERPLVRCETHAGLRNDE